MKRSGTGERGIIVLRVHLSFIQHKSPELVWKPEVAIVDVFDTAVRFNNLALVESKSFGANTNLERTKFVMLDG